MVLLAAVACAIRAFLLAAFSPVLANDSASYLDLAHRITGGHLAGSPGVRTPGYPALLALVGYSPRGIWWLQSLLGVAASLLLYRLARRLGARPVLALGGALFYAVDFEVLALEHTVLTETVASFLILVLASIAVSVLQTRSGARNRLLALGLVAAGLCLVRPDTTVLVLYLALALGAIAAMRAGEHGVPSLGRPRLRAFARPRVAAFARPAALVLVLPVLALGGWAAVNRATIGVTTVSTVLGHNMLDHVAPYVSVRPGRDRAIESAYVAARARRQARTSDLSNLSADALPAMERVSGLNYAHLSGRLLSISEGVILRHPLGYIKSSVKQWPRFFLPPNYADTFTGGTGASIIHDLWKLQRGIFLLLEVVLLAVCGVDLVSRLRHRPGVLTGPSWLLTGLVPVGMLVATFLAFGETGRYGYVYETVILAVTVAGAEPAVARLRAPRLRAGRPSQPSEA